MSTLVILDHHDTVAKTQSCVLSVEKALDTLRVFALIIWRRNVTKSLLNYLSSVHNSSWKSFIQGNRTNFSSDIMEDIVAGKDCIHYAMHATWWEWSAGSRFFFGVGQVLSGNMLGMVFLFYGNLKRGLRLVNSSLVCLIKQSNRK